MGITLLAAWGLDSFSKTWVGARVETGFDGSANTLPTSLLVYSRNPGAVFGWMADWSDPLRNTVFSVAAVVAAWLVFSIYRRLDARERLNAVALGAVVGGALGNLMDRFRFGASVDIIQVPGWPGYAGSGPTMNLADVFIVLGVAILLLELLVSEGVARAAGAVKFPEQAVDTPTALPDRPGEGTGAKKNTSP
ncbi:MAG: signal peptidase II [Myxococcota bacterium]